VGKRPKDVRASFYTPHTEVIIGVSKTRTSPALEQTSPNEIFLNSNGNGMLTRTSLEKGRISPTEAEPDFWLTRTSPDKGRTSSNNPSWVNMDDPDSSGGVRIGLSR
jgi:hypothetical protein